jgi:inhibitor of KinA
VTAPAILACGDQGYLVRFADPPVIDEQVSARVRALVAVLDGDRPSGVLDVVPGYASVLVIHDPAVPGELLPWLAGAVERAATAAAPAEAASAVEIPVLYDPEVAPDLEPVAREKDLTVEQVIALHSAPVYRCHLLGFRPGFPFLGGLDPRLVSPRLATPRLRVPAGSVGIGGAQTGVYPVASPGGWRIIGRTPARLFDPSRARPFLVNPGDRVRFVPIDRARFDAASGSPT